MIDFDRNRSQRKAQNIDEAGDGNRIHILRRSKPYLNVDLRQQLGKWARLIEVFKIRVGHAEAFGIVSSNIQKGRVEVCGCSVAEHSVARVIDVTAGLELASGIAEHHEWPFPSAALHP